MVWEDEDNEEKNLEMELADERKEEDPKEDYWTRVLKGLV